jgi:glycosyltransferase involved in cell wall biosynthesis
MNAWRESGLAGRAMLDVVTDWPLSPDDLPPGVNLVRGVSPYSATWCDLWRRADLFVMPTRHEAFGMVYQEAAGAAIPVIATDIHAIPEIVKDGITGLLVRPGDQESLVRAIRRLVDSPDLRSEMGRAARCQIAKVADPFTYASKLGDLILSLVPAHAHAPA